MPRLASSFELALPSGEDGAPKWRWLYEVLRQQILAGRLKTGTRLPATRDLARQYGLARGTVVSAFEQLKAEGYAEGQAGSGTYVSRTLPETLLQVASSKHAGKGSVRKQAVAVSAYGRQVRLFPGYEARRTHAFRPNLPALDLFPMELWTQVTARVLRRAPARALMGCEPLGYPPLRQTIAEYLSTSRGVRCSAAQTVIVSGVQEALDIAARLLIDHGAQVCMENPGYTGASMLFESYGAKICRIPLDDEGIEVTRLPQRHVRLVYVTPGHQFPLGTTMSLARRLAMIDWARTSGAVIFEDDYDSEYRYSGHPVPALQGLDRSESVFYAGTFSKVLFPALRLGYMVVPEAYIDKVEAVRSITSRHAPVLDQAILHAFIADGHFARHVRRMRGIYAERLGVLLDEAHRKLSGLLTITGVEAGLQTAAWLSAGIKGEQAETAAAQHGVEVVSLSRYADGKFSSEGLQLGFAAVNAREIKAGAEGLARALEGLLVRSRSASRN